MIVSVLEKMKRDENLIFAVIVSKRVGGGVMDVTW